MAGHLDGIKVVEITQFQQGPVAGMRLGDLGADVIKVEPETGDAGRGMMRINHLYRQRHKIHGITNIKLFSCNPLASALD